mmetsp:Transcript_19592/g.50205  ORF Transcript_19592/g.50205 Transcript_19592/m.50205 type:complete len:259 (-) Transcript_19592:2285-3061(-)
MPSAVAEGTSGRLNFTRDAALPPFAPSTLAFAPFHTCSERSTAEKATGFFSIVTRVEMRDSVESDASCFVHFLYAIYSGEPRRNRRKSRRTAPENTSNPLFFTSSDMVQRNESKHCEMKAVSLFCPVPISPLLDTLLRPPPCRSPIALSLPSCSSPFCRRPSWWEKAESRLCPRFGLAMLLPLPCVAVLYADAPPPPLVTSAVEPGRLPSPPSSRGGVAVTLLKPSSTASLPSPPQCLHTSTSTKNFTSMPLAAASSM